MPFTLGKRRRTVNRPSRRPIPQWFEIALLTALAAALRLVAIGDLPPGLYRDEAFNGLDALRVLGGQFPLFFEANNGREPLFIYLAAACVGLLGRTPGALRLVSALAGTVTVPATYAMARAWFDRRTAMLAALLCATTIWTVNLSRVAFRAVLMPPLVAGALALLWIGLSRRRPAHLVWAGVLLGFTVYTYLAARVGLVAVAAIAIYGLVWHRDALWPAGWGIVALSALLVAAPLVVYLMLHGNGFLWFGDGARAAQVSILNPAIHGGDPWGALARNIGRTALGFVARGDFIPRHNVPLRPVFAPPAALAFIGGLAIALRRARRSPAHGAALIWLGVMLLPTILAEDAPHMLRASGVLPVLFLFPALGLAALWRAIERRGHATLAALGVAALVAGGATADLYAYARHVQGEAAYYQFETGATELAVEINRFTGGGWDGEGLVARPRVPEEERRVYLVPRLWENWPSVRYLCPASDALRILPNAEAPGPTGQVMVALWPYEEAGDALALLPPDRVVTVREGARERGDLEAESRLLYVTWQTAPKSAAPYNVSIPWEQGLELVGYRLDDSSPETLIVDLYWRAEAPIDRSYTVFAHALCGETPVGQHDGPPAYGYYTTDRWRPGDLIEDRHEIALTAPCDRPACRVLVGLYRLDTMERLQIVTQGGAPSGATTVALQ
jgi:4-amino-4-deoxy-L-arabinose transferase-like glycosyltransferase